MAATIAASSIMALNISQHSSQSLWEEAFKALAPKDAEAFKSSDTSQSPVEGKRAILTQLLGKVEAKKSEWEDKRWRYHRKGEVVIVVDVWNKVTRWITSMLAVVDTIVQYDPVHAALPWAGIKLVLQIAVNDCQTQGAMAEGLEKVSFLLLRYEMVERIYLQKSSKAKDMLRASIVKLYAAVLLYIAKALKYYSQSIAKKLGKSIIEGRTRVQSVLDQVSTVESEVDAVRRDIDAEFHELSFNMLLDLPRQLQSLWTGLGNPLIRMGEQISGIQNHLNAEKRSKILRWTSVIRIQDHYEDARDDILEGTGQWLFAKQEYQEWSCSSVSSILWLRGIPGSGKSKLTTMVIEKLLHERSVSSSAAPLAFFYCARNSAEPERSDPNQVLRAIVKQLASESVKLPIRQALVDEYNARVAKYGDDIGPRRLAVKDCIKLILAITENNPITIVIDALDECDINERWALLSGLQEIIQKSKQLVKVFASSREDGDIIAQMSAVPNITIRASDNGEDIRKFVESEVNRMICTRRLLHGRVSEKLKSKIVSNLSSGAQGMFRWVSLSMQSICDVRSMKVAGDVENAIGKLPSSLRGLYDIIYDQLPIATGDSENAKELTTSQVVRRTFNWILCAQAHLSTAAFISALWIPDADEDAVDNLTKDQVLDACCNLVVHDATADTFRFAHLSVREYLENRSDFNYTYQYGMALSRCFQSFDSPNVDFSKRDWDEEPFTIYARDNIVSHYRRVELAGNDISQDQRILPQNIKTLVEETLVGCCFEKWISAIKKEVGREALTEVKRYRMKQRVCSSNSQWIPLYFASYFDLETMVYICSEMAAAKGTSPWESKNINYQAPLLLAVERDNVRAFTAMLKCGAGVNHHSESGGALLKRVMENANTVFLHIILRHCADMPLSEEESHLLYVYLLQAAILKRKWDNVRYLIDFTRGNGLKTDCPQLLFINVVRAGHYGIVELLLPVVMIPTTARDEMLSEALIVAAKGTQLGLFLNHTKVAEVLLNAGASIRSWDAEGSALAHAVNEGLQQTAQLLLSKCTGSCGIETPPQSAIVAQDTFSQISPLSPNRIVPTASEPVKTSTTDSMQRKSCNSALFAALLFGSTTMTSLLLVHGAEYTGDIMWLKDLLHFAITDKDALVVEALINCGVLDGSSERSVIQRFNVALKNDNALRRSCISYKPKVELQKVALLCSAVYSESHSIVSLLLQHGEDANEVFSITDPYGIEDLTTALDMAAERGLLDIFILLMEHKAAKTTTLANSTDLSLLEKAIIAEKINIVSFLLTDSSAIEYVRTFHGNDMLRPLAIALCGKYFDWIYLVIQHYAPTPRLKGFVYDMPIQISWHWRVNLLLLQRLNLSETTSTFETSQIFSLWNSLLNRDKSKVGSILRTARNERHFALLVAVGGRSYELVKLLIDSCGANADGDPANTAWDTPLISAIQAKNKDSAEYLLLSGADANRTSKTWRSPLHACIAVYAKKNPKLMASFAYMLVQAGADLNVVDEDGKSPMEYLAVLWENSDKKIRKLRKVLEEWGYSFDTRV